MSPAPLPFRLALLSLPWSLFNRPSIQLACLKASLEQDEHLRVDCHHPYLDAAAAIGAERYASLSRNSWAGEALYSALLFPQQADEAGKVFCRCTTETPVLRTDFKPLSELLAGSFVNWLDRTDLSGAGLIGFSVCFSQLFASLYAANLIKKRYPDIPIVFGGSSCVGAMGTSLTRCFAQIDYLIEGEGEAQLAALCRRLSGSAQPASREHDGAPSAAPGAQAALHDLPAPDYDDYFRDLDRVFPGRPFSPVLPLEFSRGCWWGKCTFCNLNLQWQGYRHKPAETLLTEIGSLQRRYQCLDFSFCDNALPPAEAERLFAATAEWDIDLNFFAEIRLADSLEQLALYRGGGLRHVQVGIEALSSSLLAKMGKGVRLIDNLAVMKQCQQVGIRLDGNLIVEFPGSTAEEAAETVEVLDYLLPFRPLTAATFFLGQGSPMERQPERYGIRALRRHPYYTSMFPADIVEGLDLLIKDFRGDKTVQKKRWLPVRRKIRQWQDFHAAREDSSLPALSYRDGGTFLLLRQERPEAKPLLHRLKGKSRQLYLFCSEVRSLAEIRQAFTGISDRALLQFFDDLAKKRLLFRQNDHFLALAVPAYGRYGNRGRTHLQTTTSGR